VPREVGGLFQFQTPELFVVCLEMRKIALAANTGHECPLSQLVPDTLNDAAITQAALLDLSPKILLERFAISIGQSN